MSKSVWGHFLIKGKKSIVEHDNCGVCVYKNMRY